MMPRHLIPSCFPIEYDELVVGGVGLVRLTELVGGTPYFAYDRKVLAARVEELRKALPSSIDIHYAVKANPMPELVAFMTKLVDGFDVASAGELEVALSAGMSPRDVSFAGPGKGVDELSAAVASGVLINVESFRELPLLASLGTAQKRKPRVAIRVNPDFELKLSGMKMSGGPKQFGIDAEDVPTALADIERLDLDFEGFQIFSGSQNLQSQAICDAHAKAFELVLSLCGKTRLAPRVINLGGGLGIPYFPGDQPVDLAMVGANLAAISKRAQKVFANAQLVLELGRYLVGEAGVYVCRILDRKISRGQIFLITDGGLHHHLSASGNFGQVVRKNFPVVIGNRVRGERREIATVVGRLCTPLDLLAYQMELADAREGDLVAIFQSGAYALTASPAKFLSHPPAREILCG
jgi:diaminopimelate decarboxylase